MDYVVQQGPSNSVQQRQASTVVQQRQVNTVQQRTSNKSRREPAYGQTAKFEVVNGEVQGRVEGQVRAGKVPGSEQILSVTDRVVDEPAATSSSSETAVATTEGPATTEKAEKVANDSAAPLTAQGWRAKRSAQ
jgi:hypothetical protein